MGTPKRVPLMLGNPYMRSSWLQDFGFIRVIIYIYMFIFRV